MLNLLMNDASDFAAHLRRINQNSIDMNAAKQTALQALSIPGEWLQYWNDAESVASNLRKLEHWLQRAHQAG